MYGQNQRTTRRRKSRRYVTPKSDGGAVVQSPPAAPDAAPPSATLSRAEIKESLRLLDVEFDGRSSTADLLDLLEAATDGDGG